MKSQVSIKKLFRKEVLGVPLYQVKGSPCPIKLNQNELPFAPEQMEQNLEARLLQPPLNRYPDEGSIALRQALAEHLDWPAEGIAVANGSNVLVQALMIACAVNAKVLSVTPTFPLYRLEAQILGNRMLEVPLKKDFSFPLAAFLKTLQRQKPRMVILSNPNAPTGNLFDDEAMLAVLAKARCLVVLDEAYYPFSQKTFFPQLKKFPHLVILRTFSKSMGLAGLRLGYLLGQPEVVAQIEKVLLPFRLSQLVQNLALRALSQEDSTANIEAVLAEKKRVYGILNDLKGVTPFPSDSNYILFRVEQNPGGENVFKQLIEQGILLRDFSKYPRLKECLRATIGTQAENERFITALKHVLTHGKSSVKESSSIPASFKAR